MPEEGGCPRESVLAELWRRCGVSSRAKEDDGSAGHRSVASKVVALLDAFGPGATELSLNELSRRSGLATSTAYRHANELVVLGFLEPGQRGGYRVGLRLWEVGSLARRGLALRELAGPYMLDLYEATHENVHLAVLDGYEALYILKTTGRLSIPVKAKEARRLPLHATGVGKVLLAYSPQEFVEQVIARGLTGFTPSTIVVPETLRRALADVQRNGYAFSAEEMTLGTMSVAAPIRDAGGRVTAALSLVSRSRRPDVQRLAPAVRTAALGISREVSASAAPS
jgi:DNA-binding IclR family transcriptional regulator